MKNYSLEKTEKQLIKECLKGSEASFKALYESYYGYCFTICMRYGVSNYDVKDYLQLIFIRVFNSLKSYDPNKGKFKTWLTTITINKILMQKRKLKIQYQELDDGKTNLLDRSFELPIEAKMDEKIMYNLLSKMPNKYISVFNLFIVDGYSHQEIAEKLDITESTSRVLLHRGRSWAMRELKLHFKDNLTNIKKAL